MSEEDKKANIKKFKEKKRHVWLRGEVTDKRAKKVIDKLFYLDSLSNEDITLFINSEGGCTSAMWAIIDVMESLESKVKTICLGEASSAGAVILAFGEHTKRFASQRSAIMIHQPWDKASEMNATDWQINAKEMIKEYEKIARELSSRTGKPYEDVLADTKEDKWMTAQEAKEYGLVDHIWDGEK